MPAIISDIRHTSLCRTCPAATKLATDVYEHKTLSYMKGDCKEGSKTIKEVWDCLPLIVMNEKGIDHGSDSILLVFSVHGTFNQAAKN